MTLTFGKQLDMHLSTLDYRGAAYTVKAAGLIDHGSVLEHSPTHLVVVDQNILHFINLDTVTLVTVEEL